MAQYSHKCIKIGCDTTYSDEDPDAYLCAVHIEEKNQIAKEIDAKFANRPKEKVMSDLELFDSQALQFTGPDGRKISFLDARPKHNG